MRRPALRARALTAATVPALRQLRPLVRWWWLAALTCLVVVATATWRDLGPAAPRRYLAIQRFAVVILPPGGAHTSYTASLAHWQEQEVARAIAEGQLLTSPDFVQAVMEQAQSKTAGRQRFTARAVAEALGATHDGNVVTLVAGWPTAPGAAALLTAAEETLAQEAPTVTPPADDAAAAGRLVRLETVGARGAPLLDPALVDTLRADLVARLAAALVASLCLVALAEWRWRRGQRATAPGASQL
jgi:hypothetical protein